MLRGTRCHSREKYIPVLSVPETPVGKCTSQLVSHDRHVRTEMEILEVDIVLPWILPLLVVFIVTLRSAGGAFLLIAKAFGCSNVKTAVLRCIL